MDSGIEFNGKHSYRDFGLTIATRQIGYPSKVKIFEEVPFSNQKFDFSNIYGGQEYTERELAYTFNVIGNTGSKEEFHILESEILNWLYGPSGKITLKDDLFPGYYFLAEADGNPDDEYILFFGGTLTAKFSAYPFKIAETEEGNDIWDSFNFLLDYAQTTEFKVNGSMDAVLYNPGIPPAYPDIVSSTPIQLTKDGVTYNVPAGQSSSPDFMLKPGENKIKIIGNGTISFHFKKEMI